MNKLRICLVSFDFPPFNKGGIATQSYDLVLHLSKENVHVSVLCAGENTGEYYLNQCIKIYRFKVPLKNKLLKFPVFQRKIKKWLDLYADDYDIIQFQEGAGFQYLISRGVKKNIDKTIEVFHHDPVEEFCIHLKFFSKIPLETVSYLFMPLKIFQEYISLRKAGHIITVSEGSRLSLLSWGINQEKITVIPNGINESSIQILNDRTKNKRTKFLYVGRLVPRKGIDTLLYAAHRIDNKGIKDIEIEIIGDGPLKNYCIKIIAKNGIKTSKLIGLTSDEKLKEIYQQTDCLICPSRHEGFGIVILEAAANNLAIILNDIPVFKEIFTEEEALYFKHNDSEDLANKIIYLHQNRNFIDIFAQRSHEKVIKFSWNRVVKEYLNLYFSIKKVAK